MLALLGQIHSASSTERWRVAMPFLLYGYLPGVFLIKRASGVLWSAELIPLGRKTGENGDVVNQASKRARQGRRRIAGVMDGKDAKLVAS